MERDCQRAEPLPEGQRRRALANVPGPDLVGPGRQGLAEEQVGRGFVGAAIAGFGHVGLGLDGPQAALAHDPADAIRGADHARVGEFRADAPIAIAAAMVLEDGFDQVADPAVLGLGGRGRGGVIEAAAGHLEAGADWTDAIAGGLPDIVDHLAELEGSLVVPRMTAAFFKMSFSWRRRRFSWRRARRSSAAERSCAPALRALGALSPAIEQIAADAGFSGDFGHRLASAQKLNGLRFELARVSLAGC